MFGSTLVQYAIMWYIVLETQSGIMSTIYIICGFLPTFLLSPFAGVWADRFNRKKLIMWSDSIIALSTLILAVLFLAGYDSIWMLFAVSAIRALGAGVQTLAVGALLPQLAPAEMLTRVNGIYNSIQSFVTLLSPMLSGALMTMATIESIFFIDVLTGLEQRHNRKSVSIQFWCTMVYYNDWERLENPEAERSEEERREKICSHPVRCGTKNK